MPLRKTHPWGQAIIAVLMLGFVGLVGRLVYIHAHYGPRLMSRVIVQQQSDIPIGARRGGLVDTRGRFFGGSELRHSIFADPRIIPDKAVAAQQAAEILGLDRVEVEQDLIAAGDRRFFPVQRGVTAEQAERIKDANVYGLGVFDEPTRVYPMNSVAAALIGFVSRDGRGVSGLENQCEQWLGGENGVKTIIRDARRKAFWLAEGGYKPARDGLHVVLTIDAEIQSAVEKELDKAVKEFGAESALAVVMHAKTGAILAMANAPGFDPNNFGDFGVDRYRNRVLTDPFEPGSTFKPFVAVGALAEGLVKFGELIDCEKGLWKDQSRLLHDHHPYGLLTFEDVLVKSSNIGMAKLGKRMGNRLLHDWVRRFGFGEKTGIDLQGEDMGMVLPFKRWTDFSTTSIPMGQEIAVTPIQLARAFCVFANGGKLVQPYIMRAILAADGRVVKEFNERAEPIEVLPAPIADMFKDRILCDVVDRGTGSKSALSGYRVFGKTGTAQIAKKGGGGYEKNAYVGSFACGAPAKDPQLVVLVCIRRTDKSRGYYGGTVAAPVAREILRHALAYLEIPPDRPGGSATASATTAVQSD